jgi:hypothetical protein
VLPDKEDSESGEIGDHATIEELGADSMIMSSLLSYLSTHTSNMHNIGMTPALAALRYFV